MKRHYTHQTVIRLTKLQDHKLKRAAMAYGITVSDVVRKFLEPLFNLSEKQIIIDAVVSEVMAAGENNTGRR